MENYTTKKNARIQESVASTSRTRYVAQASNAARVAPKADQ